MASRLGTMEDLAREQHAEPIADPMELAADIRESDAELEDLLTDVQASRNFPPGLTLVRDIVSPGLARLGR